MSGKPTRIRCLKQLTMPWLDFVWTEQFLQKLSDRGIGIEEVREVVEVFGSIGEISKSTGAPLARGYASTGRYLVVVYRWIDDITVQPVTAFTPDRD